MYLSAMAAAGAIWHRHLPDGGIQWLLGEARDVLHWAMCPALYRCIRMVIEITSTFPAFFVFVDSVVANKLR